MSTIYAFDFDGVLCDSAGELGRSAWKCAATIWPDDFIGDADDAFINAYKLLRPHIHTGYQSVFLARYIQQTGHDTLIGQNMEELAASVCERNELTEHEVKRRFSESRDTWIATDFASWVAANDFYELPMSFFRDLVENGEQVVIITTKEKRFCSALCEAADSPLDDSNIFGLEAGPKNSVLNELLAREDCGAVHFIEDRLPTLMTSMREIDDPRLKLFFADWGYSDENDKRSASAEPNINSLSLNRLNDFR